MRRLWKGLIGGAIVISSSVCPYLITRQPRGESLCSRREGTRLFVVHAGSHGRHHDIQCKQAGGICYSTRVMNHVVLQS